MQKKALIYMIIFIVVCGAIGWVSRAFDDVIVKWYLVDVKEELKGVFEANNNIHLKGDLLSIYLLDSYETFNYNSQKYNNYIELDDIDNFVTKSFDVKKIDEELMITESNNITNTKLKSVLVMEKVLIYRKIITNLVTAVVGIIFLLMYYKRKQLKSNNLLNEMPN